MKIFLKLFKNICYLKLSLSENLRISIPPVMEPPLASTRKLTRKSVLIGLSCLLSGLAGLMLWPSPIVVGNVLLCNCYHCYCYEKLSSALIKWPLFCISYKYRHFPSYLPSNTTQIAFWQQGKYQPQRYTTGGEEQFSVTDLTNSTQNRL